ncbi:Rrf2 family transcriptional regulator [Ancylobacter sp. FA202]|uniref:RrF2 family transcriptional regulator n=1 Tax=Ancylobacter sp. FA202 TaxID=1111106 RepID=UPI00037666C6|nr:Rrf2 family transcriptional regulator [Ancylobacter sp. FA202]
MLTNKGKYGLKAMVHLAALDAGTTTMGAEIARAENIPKKFLDAILLDLRNAGIVRSKKGPGGGYCLARAPKEIRVGHIIRTLDGPLAPIGCASQSAYVPCQDCENLASCEVRIVMTRVRDALSDILDRMTLEEMVSFGRTRHPDLMYHI